jgi:hypothetical protein
LEAHRSGSQADAWAKTNLKWLFVAGTSAQNAFACADYASKRQQAQLSLLVRRVVKRLRIRRELVLRGAGYGLALIVIDSACGYSKLRNVQKS